MLIDHKIKELKTKDLDEDLILNSSVCVVLFCIQQKVQYIFIYFDTLPKFFI